jgi:hypothetical protein
MQQSKRFPMFSLIALYLSYRKQAAEAPARIAQPTPSRAQKPAPDILALAA